MGMFDTLWDERGRDWQTKAYQCELGSYRIGQVLPRERFTTYQVAILGEIDDNFIHSFATVRDDILTAIHVDRDESLPLLDYHGGFISIPKDN